MLEMNKQIYKLTFSRVFIRISQGCNMLMRSVFPSVSVVKANKKARDMLEAPLNSAVSL